MLADMKLPPLECFGAQGARATFWLHSMRARPAGRPGRRRLSTAHSPAPDGPLSYRLYRPGDARGPHPIVVYFHGGGLGVGWTRYPTNRFCRDMCRRSGMIFVSVGYRHAARIPLPDSGRGWLRGDAVDRRGMRLTSAADRDR